MQVVGVKGAGMLVGGHWDHSLPFPTIPACPVAPLALKLVPGREGGSEGAREVHCCWRGHSPELPHLAGARGREDGVGVGMGCGGTGCESGQGPEGGEPQTK